MAAMQAKMDAITGVYDDLHEKMHEIDKTRRDKSCLRSLIFDLRDLDLLSFRDLLSCLRSNLNLDPTSDLTTKLAKITYS